MFNIFGLSPWCLCRSYAVPLALRHEALARPRALHLLSTTPNEAVVISIGGHPAQRVRQASKS
jgi:hypothetical protein